MIFIKLASILAVLSSSSHTARAKAIAAHGDEGVPKLLRGGLDTIHITSDAEQGVDGSHGVALEETPGESICGIEKSRYVKVSLSGFIKILSLAEVQVFTMIDGVETNVALASSGAIASQSSTLYGTAGYYDASKAIDGNTEGIESEISHTLPEINPFWEVKLNEAHYITKIVVWNRQDRYNEFLSQATVSLLGETKDVKATFSMVKEPQNSGEGTKGPSFAFILPPQSCTLVTGTYNTRPEDNAGTRPWWAFKPDNCPTGGCPLFFWIDGTNEVDFKEEREQSWMTEMYNRGYVAVTVDYASFFIYGGGCYERDVGVVDKAKDIFDRANPNSVINQLCNKEYVNCGGGGVAVSGFSQGAQIVSLAADFDDRVSAALLYGDGNRPTGYPGHQYCMDTVKLPRQRRRYFSGDNDPLFFKGYDRARRQLIEMSHYDDCTSTNAPDNCLEHGQTTVNDPYTGGTIDNTGGYYIVENGFHGQFLEWSNFTGTSVDFNRNQHLDWLARTSQNTKPTLEEETAEVILTVDLDHWALIGETVDQGIFFEWAANINNKGVLGRRHVVARDTTWDEVRFSDGVPKDVIGFRLTARTHNAAFVDRLDVKRNDGSIFKGLNFERDRYDGFCFSTVPARDWDRCIGGESYLCIDFCTDGTWHVCDEDITIASDDPDAPASAQMAAEFSKCPT